MATDWEAYAHMLESELVAAKRDRDGYKWALERLQVVADDRLVKLRNWKRWADGQEHLLDEKREELEASEKLVGSLSEELQDIQWRYARTLVALMERDLASAGVPKVLRRLYLSGMIDASMVEESLEATYGIDSGEYHFRAADLIEDFWLWAADRINDADGELPEHYFQGYVD